MKKRLFALIAVLIFITVTAMPVYADMGPKPSIELTVKNAPDEDYYINLLVPGTLRKKEDRLQEVNEQYSGKDAELMRVIINNTEDGWYPRRGGHFRELTQSKSSRKYEFSYMDVPKTFKVIIVTESGKVIVSNEITRKAFNAVTTFDAKTGKLRERKTAILAKQLERFLITFIATLLIEGMIFRCFEFEGKEGHNFAVIFKTNLCTQLLLYVVISLLPLHMLIYGGIFAAEIIITIIEGCVYSKLLTPKGKGARYAIVANILSFVLSLPMWFILEFFFRISI
ncbi:hypothetical protein [Ruminococcus albus]|uniref:Uncharacterized protein n=1 Tax=Ruminococcus albus TaxID=1264 RepID=A0A1I1PSM5_RUMAL|nr:hypothetical protein [Ruminococcus albus]SFD12846.1 hypothetical protein SAMN02910406_03170 [Ruminococcus albus]